MSRLNKMSCQVTAIHHRQAFLALTLFGTAVIAAEHMEKDIILPETYRTPLSDMALDKNLAWRSAPDEQNPWRGNGEEETIKPRIQATMFPKYNYNSVENPNPGSLFQNENEIDKPVSNIFRYTF